MKAFLCWLGLVACAPPAPKFDFPTWECKWVSAPFVAQTSDLTRQGNYTFLPEGRVTMTGKVIASRPCEEFGYENWISK
jgi:hypothetical protein